jgi:hypothetical protein
MPYEVKREVVFLGRHVGLDTVDRDPVGRHIGAQAILLKHFMAVVPALRRLFRALLRMAPTRSIISLEEKA